jgi:hypothetical protein
MAVQARHFRPGDGKGYQLGRINTELNFQIELRAAGACELPEAA